MSTEVDSGDWLKPDLQMGAALVREFLRCQPMEEEEFEHKRNLKEGHLRELLVKHGTAVADGNLDKKKTFLERWSLLTGGVAGLALAVSLTFGVFYQWPKHEVAQRELEKAEDELSKTKGEERRLREKAYDYAKIINTLTEADFGGLAQPVSDTKRFENIRAAWDGIRKSTGARLTEKNRARLGLARIAALHVKTHEASEHVNRILESEHDPFVGLAAKLERARLSMIESEFGKAARLIRDIRTPLQGALRGHVSPRLVGDMNTMYALAHALQGHRQMPLVRALSEDVRTLGIYRDAHLGALIVALGRTGLVFLRAQGQQLVPATEKIPLPEPLARMLINSGNFPVFVKSGDVVGDSTHELVVVHSMPNVVVVGVRRGPLQEGRWEWSLPCRLMVPPLGQRMEDDIAGRGDTHPEAFVVSDITGDDKSEIVVGAKSIPHHRRLVMLQAREAGGQVTLHQTTLLRGEATTAYEARSRKQGFNLSDPTGLAVFTTATGGAEFVVSSGPWSDDRRGYGLSRFLLGQSPLRLGETSYQPIGDVVGLRRFDAGRTPGRFVAAVRAKQRVVPMLSGHARPHGLPRGVSIWRVSEHGYGLVPVASCAHPVWTEESYELRELTCGDLTGDGVDEVLVRREFRDSDRSHMLAGVLDQHGNLHMHVFARMPVRFTYGSMLCEDIDGDGRAEVLGLDEDNTLYVFGLGSVCRDNPSLDVMLRNPLNEVVAACESHAQDSRLRHSRAYSLDTQDQPSDRWVFEAPNKTTWSDGGLIINASPTSCTPYMHTSIPLPHTKGAHVQTTWNFLVSEAYGQSNVSVAIGGSGGEPLLALQVQRSQGPQNYWLRAICSFGGKRTSSEIRPGMPCRLVLSARVVDKSRAILRVRVDGLASNGVWERMIGDASASMRLGPGSVTMLPVRVVSDRPSTRQSDKTKRPFRGMIRMVIATIGTRSSVPLPVPTSERAPWQKAATKMVLGTWHDVRARSLHHEESREQALLARRVARGFHRAAHREFTALLSADLDVRRREAAHAVLEILRLRTGDAQAVARDYLAPQGPVATLTYDPDVLYALLHEQPNLQEALGWTALTRIPEHLLATHGFAERVESGASGVLFQLLRQLYAPITRQ